MNINTLFIINSWQQAQEIQDKIIQSSSLETQRSPKILCDEWYYSQGEIEWYDVNNSNWKNNIQSHMQDRRVTQLMDGCRLTMVIWNAQKMNEYDWYMWKDMKADITSIFISDCDIRQARNIGLRVIKMPVIEKQFPKLGKIMDEFLQKSKTKINWKKIIDFRNCVLNFIEWNESYSSIKKYLTEKSFTILDTYDKYNVTNITILSEQVLDLLSKSREPLSLVLMSEKLLILLLKIINT